MRHFGILRECRNFFLGKIPVIMYNNAQSGGLLYVNHDPSFCGWTKDRLGAAVISAWNCSGAKEKPFHRELFFAAVHRTGN